MNPFDFKAGVIDHESATKIYELLNGDSEEVDAETVVNAFVNVLAFKLEKSKRVPSDKVDTYANRFERFFDRMFEVAPEHKALPAELVLA